MDSAFYKISNVKQLDMENSSGIKVDTTPVDNFFKKRGVGNLQTASKKAPDLYAFVKQAAPIKSVMDAGALKQRYDGFYYSAKAQFGSEFVSNISDITRLIFSGMDSLLKTNDEQNKLVVKNICDKIDTLTKNGDSIGLWEYLFRTSDRLRELGAIG